MTMRHFIDIVEATSPDSFWDDSSISFSPEKKDFFDKHFIGLKFRNEEEARRHILSILMKVNNGSLVSTDGENEKRIAASAPVYFDGEYYRIGTSDNKPVLTWDEIELRHEQRHFLNMTAAANFEDYEIDFSAKMHVIAELLPPKSDDIYLQGREWQRIVALAEAIRENMYFTPIVVGVEEDEHGNDQKWIVEGQHRARALLYVLGVKTVPGYTITSWD